MKKGERKRKAAERQCVRAVERERAEQRTPAKKNIRTVETNKKIKKN